MARISLNRRMFTTAGLLIALGIGALAQSITITGWYGQDKPDGTQFTDGSNYTVLIDSPPTANYPVPGLWFYVSGTDRNGNAIDPSQVTVNWKMNATFQDRCHGQTAFQQSHSPNPCPTAGGVQVGFTNKLNPVGVQQAGDVGFNPANVADYGGAVVVQAEVYADPNHTGQCTGSNDLGSASLHFQVYGSSASPGGARIHDWLAQLQAPWFTGKILSVESNGHQFFSSGRPYFGYPDGNGLMQVDRTENPDDYGGAGNNPYQAVQNPYWDFAVNISDGVDFVNGLKAGAENQWRDQLAKMCAFRGSTYSSGNACDDGGGIDFSTATAAPTPLGSRIELCKNGPGGVGQNVAFAYGHAGQPSGTLPFTTALWIQDYNGACTSGDFVQFDSDGKWHLGYPYPCQGVEQFNYVMAVCSRAGF